MEFSLHAGRYRGRCGGRHVRHDQGGPFGPVRVRYGRPTGPRRSESHQYDKRISRGARHQHWRPGSGRRGGRRRQGRQQEEGQEGQQAAIPGASQIPTLQAPKVNTIDTPQVKAKKYSQLFPFDIAGQNIAES